MLSKWRVYMCVSVGLSLPWINIYLAYIHCLWFPTNQSSQKICRQIQSRSPYNTWGSRAWRWLGSVPFDEAPSVIFVLDLCFFVAATCGWICQQSSQQYLCHISCHAYFLRYTHMHSSMMFVKNQCQARSYCNTLHVHTKLHWRRLKDKCISSISSQEQLTIRLVPSFLLPFNRVKRDTPSI